MKGAPNMTNQITMKGVSKSHSKVVIRTLRRPPFMFGAESQFGSDQAILSRPASINRWRVFRVPIRRRPQRATMLQQSFRLQHVCRALPRSDPEAGG
jgi:hypothetical protein